MSAIDTNDEDSWRHLKRWYPRHPELGQRGRIPVEPFVSEEQAERERRLLWPHVWLMVGRVEDIPEPGNYLIKEIPPVRNVSLIIVRGRDREIRAFHNVCTHRGSQICWEEDGGKGSAAALSCPYHGFTFDLSGKLAYVPDEANYYDLDKSKLGLRQVISDVWEGLVFVHLAPNPRETLKEYMGDIGAHFAGHRFQDQRHAYEFKAVLNCNWKVLMSGFLEAFHTRSLHPGARHRGCTPSNPYSHMEFARLMGKHRLLSLYRNPDMELPRMGQKSLARYRKAKPPRTSDTAAPAPAAQSNSLNFYKSFIIHNIFPNLQLNIVNGAWFYHQFWPLGAGRVAWHTRMNYPKPGNASERFFQEYSKVASRDILLEDGNASERSQRALESGALNQLILQDDEVAIQHFIKVVADYTAADK